MSRPRNKHNESSYQQYVDDKAFIIQMLRNEGVKYAEDTYVGSNGTFISLPQLYNCNNECYWFVLLLFQFLYSTFSCTKKKIMFFLYIQLMDDMRRKLFDL